MGKVPCLSTFDLPLEDDMENKDKEPEIQWRKNSVKATMARNDLRGQIKNTPEYIAKAIVVCKFLGGDVYISPYKADPQVLYVSSNWFLIPVTVDLDLLTYDVLENPGKLIIVKEFQYEYFRMIDLMSDVEPGEYSLLEIYKKHGKIVFQLYAACLGCYFTTHRSSIKGVGYETLSLSQTK